MGGNILHNTHMRHMLRSQTARFQTHGHRQIQRNASLRVSESQSLINYLFHLIPFSGASQLDPSAVLKCLRGGDFVVTFRFSTSFSFLSFLVTLTCSSNLEPVAKDPAGAFGPDRSNVFGQCSSLESSFWLFLVHVHPKICIHSSWNSWIVHEIHEIFIPKYASEIHEIPWNSYVHPRWSSQMVIPFESPRFFGSARLMPSGVELDGSARRSALVRKICLSLKIFFGTVCRNGWLTFNVWLFFLKWFEKIE